MPTRHPSCSNCNANKDQLPHCARCKGVSYCDRGCQKLDWARHKEMCKDPTPEDKVALFWGLLLYRLTPTDYDTRRAAAIHLDWCLRNDNVLMNHATRAISEGLNPGHRTAKFQMCAESVTLGKRMAEILVMNAKGWPSGPQPVTVANMIRRENGMLDYEGNFGPIFNVSPTDHVQYGRAIPPPVGLVIWE